MLVVNELRSTAVGVKRHPDPDTLAVIAGVVDLIETSTQSLYPPTAVSVRVEAPVAPAAMISGLGLALATKSGVETVAPTLVSGIVCPPETTLIQTPGTLSWPRHPVWKPMGVPGVLATTVYTIVKRTPVVGVVVGFPVAIT